jgi:hypothetical protein
MSIRAISRVAFYGRKTINQYLVAAKGPPGLSIEAFSGQQPKAVRGVSEGKPNFLCPTS